MFCVDRLEVEMARLGGTMIRVQKLPTRFGVHHSPFCHCSAIDYPKRVLFVMTQCAIRHVGDLIHECGHLFASPVGPHHRECHEFDWFGWEYAMALRVHAVKQWYGSSGSYALDSYRIGGKDFYGAFGELSDADRKILLHERIAKARELGILDGRWLPIAAERKSCLS